MKKCPFCGENIISNAIQCNYCKKDLSNSFFENNKNMMDEALNKIKKCPYCAEEIKYEAIKCKHCGEMLNGSQPTSKREKIDFERPESITIFCILMIVSELMFAIIWRPYGFIGLIFGLIPIIGLLMMKKWAAYFVLILNVITLIATSVFLLALLSGGSYSVIILLLCIVQIFYNILFIVTINGNMYLME